MDARRRTGDDAARWLLVAAAALFGALRTRRLRRARGRRAWAPWAS
jgi:hypothetical protein